MSEALSIISVMEDPRLFGRFFHGSSWDTWKVFLKGLFCLVMTRSELKRFAEFTGRSTAPLLVTEAWIICGRKSGKSRISALIAVFLACFKDYSGVLAAGEVGTVQVIAVDRRQARVIMRYIIGFLESVPMLASKIVKQNLESIELDNRIIIEIFTASSKSTRGYTVVACIADELAFWKSDFSADPAREIVASILPSMATVPGALLIALSSPWTAHGLLYDRFKENYGMETSSRLIWRAPTKMMNPKISEQIIQEAYRADPATAATEWGAEWKSSDRSKLIPLKRVQAVVIERRSELPPIADFQYSAYCDPAGGGEEAGDSFTLAVGHRENDLLILDALREKEPPFSPQETVKEFAQLLRKYRVSSVTGDKYSGAFVVELFLQNGISYETSHRPKSELYLDLLPAINSQKIELLDNEVLISQLCGLERKSGRAGRDSVDHPIGARDDLINSTAGLFSLLAPVGSPLFFIDFPELDEPLPPASPEVQEQLQKEVEAFQEGRRKQRERDHGFFDQSIQGLKRNHF